ncbi:Lrp/AsnC family transcriptional regulator [Mizugakiibacter sediminis]|uniref:ArsR family transcriptional regulator n=2 Tax=Mizugakiibacter sediminis TaxID=1475481 RepID=A0A0K8QPF7_9GAMM|nr:Lrp/AsnC family transcriptional regulator [Mizugakiibacter sediminis]
MRSSSEVQQCNYVTGSSDFMLVVTAWNMTAYEDFTRRKFFDNPNIRGFRTSVVMDRVKVGLDVPLAPDGSGETR